MPKKKTTTKTVTKKTVKDTTPIKKAVKTAVKRRRKRKSKGKMYFTKDTEDAIVAFNNSDDNEFRQKIYNERIHYPFCKLAENIFNTFKFSYFDTSPQDVQKQVVSACTANIMKYKQDNGKAFSYFSIVAKNWLILNNNNTFKKWKQHTEILDAPDSETQGEILIVEESKDDEIKEFNSLMVDYWDEHISNVFTKKRELEIANAIIELFRNSDRLENFNKKALYLYIREISGCKTQNITKVINKMKDHQRSIHNEYLDDGVVTIHSDGSDDSFFSEY